MNRFIKKYGLYLLGCFSLLLNSCIYENLDDCKTYSIHFVYNYNLKYTDLFSEEATKMNLYVFDTNGNFVEEFQDTRTSFPKTYNMEVPLPSGEYTFIVWSGVYPEAYTVEGGNAHREVSLPDFKLRLTELAAEETSQNLPNLFYGRLESTTVGINKVDTISLIKNTKTITVTMLPINDSSSLNKENYKIWVESPDGIYDNSNNPQGGVIKYRPYFDENNSDGGFSMKLNTLRLMADATNTLVVETSYNEPLIRFDLNKIIDELRMVSHNNLLLQEYLDRQDEYDIVINGITDDDMFSSISLTVNGWLIRVQSIHN